MKFALLASGSKGNCCIVTHKNTNIVIDCGTTKKYLMSCFDQLSYDYKHSDALLITHTHTDHISQLNMFDGVPTYATSFVKSNQYRPIVEYESFFLRDVLVTAISLSHDCERTVGYILEADGEKLVYVTDTGYVKDEAKAYLKNANYYIFESNHDMQMLMETNRPMYIKQRILGDSGHLCNEDSARVLSEIIGDQTTEIVLAHLSEEGNSAKQALSILKAQLIDKEIEIAHKKMAAAKQYEIYIGGNQKDG